MFLTAADNLSEPRLRRSSHGSVAVVALISIIVLAAISASVLKVVIPRFHVTYQTAGWQEARLAAEAGIDISLERLNGNLPDPTRSTADWRGWKNDAGQAAAGSALSRSQAGPREGITATGNSLIATPSIFMDNLEVTQSGTRAVAEIQLTALYPSSDPNATNPWFRIRSMGTASLSGPPRSSIDRMDTSLRRLSLRAVRPTLERNDFLTPSPIPLPHASRIVEVLAKPVHSFQKAIVTNDRLELGQSSQWKVDSYDSSDPAKSGPLGVYPRDDSNKIQSNGHVASNKAHPSPNEYGPLIDANGAIVDGEVHTNGGDNPATQAHENVSEATGIDPGRVFADFNDPVIRPPELDKATLQFQTNPAGITYAAGQNTENYYHVRGDLGPLIVSGTGRITIFVDGKWDIGTGGDALVRIPPGVQATIYVKGNIDFGNGMVNTDAGSSQIPGSLIIYGVPTPNADGTLPPRTLGASGNPQIAAAFYGPSYAVSLSGTTEWYGAVACSTFEISGGGHGGFHYDEALGQTGFIRRFQITSYFEDARQ